MVGKPVPDALVDVGTYVELHDGRIGHVEHYEFFNPRQTQFPVRVDAQVLLLTRQHLRSVPAVIVPVPRQEDPRGSRRPSAKV
jgi:hypothetical protein